MQEIKIKNSELSWFEIFIKLFYKALCFCFKFCIYIIISFLQMLIDFLYDFLDLEGCCFVRSFADESDKEESKKDTVEYFTKHIYTFERSELYNSTFDKLRKDLNDFNKNHVCINDDIYKDILEKIAILTVEVEKKALQEGYSYASYTKYRLSEDEVYNDFVEYKIMKGEGHGTID